MPIANIAELIDLKLDCWHELKLDVLSKLKGLWLMLLAIPKFQWLFFGQNGLVAALGCLVLSVLGFPDTSLAFTKVLQNNKSPVSRVLEVPSKKSTIRSSNGISLWNLRLWNHLVVSEVSLQMLKNKQRIPRFSTKWVLERQVSTRLHQQWKGLRLLKRKKKCLTFLYSHATHIKWVTSLQHPSIFPRTCPPICRWLCAKSWLSRARSSASCWPGAVGVLEDEEFPGSRHPRAPWLLH